MKSTKVIRYSIPLYYFDNIENQKARLNYAGLKRYYKENGKSISITDRGKNAVVYRPELALVLITTDIPATGFSEKHEPFETTLNGTAFKAVYLQGFIAGEKHFEKEFKLSPDTLYGQNAERYVRNLHHNFFHQCEKSSLHGWNYWRNSYPFIISEKNIYDYGFYSGLVHSVERLAEKHPALFKDFDKCEMQTGHKPDLEQTVIEQVTKAVQFVTNEIERKISKAENIADKISICNKYIKIYEQQIATPLIPEPVKDLDRPKHRLDNLISAPVQILNWLKAELKYWQAASVTKNNLPDNNNLKAEIKPTFKPEAVAEIFNILKDFFTLEHQAQLEQILKTGNNSNEKLLFRGNGKTLLDTFKQLMKGHFLFVAVQKDFEKWISDNFMFLDKRKPSVFKPKYASRIISGNERAAKGNRLIDVKSVKGKFEIHQLEIMNREHYPKNP